MGGNEPGPLSGVVTLPFPVRELSNYPTQLEYHEYRGGGEALAALVDTALWVTPYLVPVDYEAILPAMTRLQVVQTQSAGTDDIAPWLPPGVALCNARGVHDAATAEMAAALILASLRELPTFFEGQRRERWSPNNQAQALADKTVLIIGFGSIGQALGRRLAGFDCEIVGVSRHGRAGTRTLDDMPVLLPAADVVVILVPLTQETRHLVDVDFLARMKSGSLLVNMSRGGVVDTGALVAELRSGRLSAALDVTDPEPLPPGHPLWSSGSVLITPHAGGGTSAMGPRMRRLIEEQLFRFARGEPLANVVG